MPNFLPEGMDVNALMAQIAATATSPTPSPQGNLPPGFEGASPDPQTDQIDWSWLTNLFQTSPGARPAYNPRIGPTGADQSSGGFDLGALFQTSPQSALTAEISRKIQEKSGRFTGRGSYQANLIAAQAAQRAQSDAAYRAQLAGWLGWNEKNAHVQSWVANGGGIPDNPTQAQAIAGATSPASGSTAPASAVAAASTAKVPFPFPYSDFSNPGYKGNNFGDPLPPGTYWGGWQWHKGQDYGVAQGTTLNFPFAGKVKTVGYDPQGYGHYITVEFGDQGATLTFAHLSYVQAKQGDTINPGEQIGLTGGGGSGQGISTGPHLLIVEQNGRGDYLDPRPLLESVYNNGQGTTMATLQNQGVASTGVPVTPGTTPQYEVTPDGHVLWDGTPDRQYYDLVNGTYSKLYGTNAPYSIVKGMQEAGVTNASQMAAVAANWPSDIPGISFAQRDAIYNNASAISMKNWGRPIPDGLVKRLASQGLTSNNDIKEWFDSHVSSDIPAADYKQIYDAAAPAIHTTYGDGPAPDYIGYLWGKTQNQPIGQPTTGTQGKSAVTPG